MAVKVKQRKGAWWLVIRLGGRCKWRRVGVGRTGKRAANTAAEKIAAKLALGDVTVLHDRPEPSVTLATFAANWLRDSVAPRLKPSSHEKYAATLKRHWLPALGSRLLTAISREDIRRVLAEKIAAGLKPVTVRGDLDILRACLGTAVEDGLIPTNHASASTRGVWNPGRSRSSPARS